jgi:hypothetical protein
MALSERSEVEKGMVIWMGGDEGLEGRALKRKCKSCCGMALSERKGVEKGRAIGMGG